MRQSPSREPSSSHAPLALRGGAESEESAAASRASGVKRSCDHVQEAESILGAMDWPSDTESDASYDEATGHGKVVLDADHALNALRPEIRKFVFEKFREWEESARFTVPPEFRLPSPKRHRRSSKKPRASEDLEASEVSDDYLIIPQNDGYFRIACPFSVSDPGAYKSCMVQYDLKTIEDVIRHVQYHHRIPPYCPRCNAIFSRASVRDDHLKTRTCTVRSPKVIPGLSWNQVDRITDFDDARAGDRARWMRIWEICFPSEQPSSPLYLSSGVGRLVSLCRGFWAAHGFEYIMQVAERLGAEKVESWVEEGAIDALTNSALQDLLENIFQEWDMNEFRRA
ncbi:hypothetical protein B0I35DRAFT_477824 [Stachybotrys elegans]|uniref:C2H2-type domain-containing protein n=1 Tax=Stachybotrys elegans TaxID=80388 RepID=A0A8K0SUQ7_9HYPO|nr:hypothetical protein B0I35DRAFT_477824 [Stachybotrys elegans]